MSLAYSRPRDPTEQAHCVWFHPKRPVASTGGTSSLSDEQRSKDGKVQVATWIGKGMSCHYGVLSKNPLQVEGAGDKGGHVNGDMDKSPDPVKPIEATKPRGGVSAKEAREIRVG